MRTFLAALAGIVLGSSASAATMIATFEGTITKGFDDSYLFGLPTTDLVGQDFSLTYRYDPERGVQIRSTGEYGYESVTHSDTWGGLLPTSLSGLPLNAVFEVNGRSIFTTGDYGYSYGNFSQTKDIWLSAAILSTDSRMWGSIPTDSDLGPQYTASHMSSYLESIVSDVPLRFDTPFRAFDIGDSQNSGHFIFSSSCFYMSSNDCPAQTVDADLRLTRLTVAVAPVPLPSTIIALLGALLGLGFVARRKTATDI